MSEQDQIPDHPFNQLYDLVEAAAERASKEFRPDDSGSRSGFIGFVVIRELARSGYTITSPTGSNTRMT